MMFGVLFMPGIFSRMIYDPSGSKDAITQFFVDTNMALALFLFMIVALPVLWFLDTKFAVIPSTVQCYVMIFLSLGVSYLAGYIALGAPAMSAVLFMSAVGTVTICVIKRNAWYVDDIWVFSIIGSK